MVESDELQARFVPKEYRIVTPREVEAPRALAVGSQVHRPPFARKGWRLKCAWPAFLGKYTRTCQACGCTEAERQDTAAIEHC